MIEIAHSGIYYEPSQAAAAHEYDEESIRPLFVAWPHMHVLRLRLRVGMVRETESQRIWEAVETGGCGTIGAGRMQGGSWNWIWNLCSLRSNTGNASPLLPAPVFLANGLPLKKTNFTLCSGSPTAKNASEARSLHDVPRN